jgi:hypothetical protein
MFVILLNSSGCFFADSDMCYLARVLNWECDNNWSVWNILYGSGRQMFATSIL